MVETNHDVYLLMVRRKGRNENEGLEYWETLLEECD